MHYFQGSRAHRPPGGLNTIYALMCLADDTFARPSQSGGGKCPHVPRNKGACPPPIENSLSYVSCSPLLSLFFCFRQKLALLSPFMWNKCHFPCSQNTWGSLINIKFLIQFKLIQKAAFTLFLITILLIAKKHKPSRSNVLYDDSSRSSSKKEKKNERKLLVGPLSFVRKAVSK